MATLESLSSLVSRSVVSADTNEIPTRYLLLESVRAYCRSRDPDPVATRLAHALWVRGLADRCVAAMRTRQTGPFLRGLARELPNIRAGVAHDLDLDPHAAMHMLAGFGLFLTRVVHNTEALHWVRAVSRAAPDAPVADRARVAINLVALNDFAGNFDEARRLVAQAVDTVFAELTEEHDPLDRGELHYFLGYSAVETRHVDIALDQAQKAIEVGTQSGIRWVAGAGRVVHAVARALQALLDGDFDALAEAAREATGSHAAGRTRSSPRSTCAIPTGR
ncbi:hypothetical protein [Actinocrispum sp. NPDC049592]|uniref:hypothetical protein n=1 Tax=Actinocrispum sp. NPDC049592 TaxID=3154835 RepID=UPI003439FEF3